MHALGWVPQLQPGMNIQEVRRELSAAVQDDVIRLEVIQALMRPFDEGLALFAEYDAFSRAASKAWSPLPVAVAWNFAGLERLKVQAARGFVEPFSTMFIAGELVEKARLSQQAIDAKASVLVQPLASAAGGYLPGYLAVKHMWRRLYRQDIRLYGESDLALAYMRSYFYEDLPFAMTLLAPPIPNSIMSTNEDY